MSAERSGIDTERCGRARAALGPALCLVALLLAPAAGAQDEIVVESGGAVWTITNDGGTSNGLPAGGFCDGSPGMTVADVSFNRGTPGAPTLVNGYDNGHLVFIDGVQFAPSEFDESSRSILAGPEELSGLDVRVEYGVATTTATMRTLIGLTNPSSDEISVTVDHVTNVGTNALTEVLRTSSGDTGFNVLDRWIITWDPDFVAPRPLVTHVHRGTNQDENGMVQLATAVSRVVFRCPEALADTEGIRVTYDVTVPANETRYLLFFNQINDNPSSAVSLAIENFDENPPVGEDLLFGLLPEVLVRVVNWDFRPVCRIGTKLDLKLKQDKGKLDYFFARGEATLKSEFADPTDLTTYSLCIVDFFEGVPEIEECYTLLPGAEWREESNGFRYRDKGGAQDGITRFRVRRGERGRTKITAEGKDALLPDLPLSQDPQVAVIVANSNELCWIGRFEDEARRNDDEQFKARERGPRPE